MREDESETNHDYYQWVALTLIAQAVVFYLPGCFWTSYGAKRVDDVIGEHAPKVIDDMLGEGKEQLVARAEDIARQVKEHSGSNGRWAATFLLCELLNLCVTVSQAFFTNYFLGGNFIQYGYNVFHHVLNETDSCHPMEKVK